MMGLDYEAMSSWLHGSSNGIIVALLLVVVSLYVGNLQRQQRGLQLRREAFKLEHGCQPPTSILPGFDPLGLVFMYRILTVARKHEFLPYFQSLFAKYGNTAVVVRWTGTGVFSCDAENIKCVLSTRFDDWAVKEIRQKGFKWLLGDGIFTTDGAFWAHSRAALRPAFEKTQVADLSQLESHIGLLLENIPKDGSTVDLQELFHRFTMDTSSELLLGESTGSLSLRGGGEPQRFADEFDYGMADGIQRARLGRLYWLVPYRPKALRAIRFCRKFVDSYVQRVLNNKTTTSTEKKAKGKFIFLEELAKREEVDATRVRNEALNVLLAGRDTTASLLSCLWFMLARHPDAFKKLQAEVDELGGDLPTYDRLRNMKYIKYCAQETLRLMPPVPMLSKVAIRDTVLAHGGGQDGQQPLFVAKGSVFAYNIFSMMRQTSVFGADAESFRPERWADDSLRPGWNFLPFGGGPRVCLGQQYALTECYYVTIRLMQHFRKIEDRDGTPWKEKLTVTCASLNGTKVALTS